MDDKRELLQSELYDQGADMAVCRAFAELCYTAKETGMTEFCLRGDDIGVFVRLCGLAHKYRDGVPPELRM